MESLTGAGSKCWRNRLGSLCMRHLGQDQRWNYVLNLHIKDTFLGECRSAVHSVAGLWGCLFFSSVGMRKSAVWPQCSYRAFSWGIWTSDRERFRIYFSPIAAFVASHLWRWAQEFSLRWLQFFSPSPCPVKCMVLQDSIYPLSFVLSWIWCLLLSLHFSSVSSVF